MMEKINDGGPAYPVHTVYQDCGIDGNSGPTMTETISSGMTLRDYFAAKAMQAHVPGLMDTTDGVRSLADDAYKIADAMLKARGVQS